MTVGELVDERWRAHKQLWVDAGTLDGEVPAFRVKDALSSLGIWDAEVLEGKFSPGSEFDLCNGEGEIIDTIDYIHDQWGHCRIIVLPKEGK